MQRNLAIQSKAAQSGQPIRRSLPLSPELLSLVQHVELNKAGWWERTVQKLILMSVWLQGGNIRREQIIEDLRQRCGVHIDQRILAKLDALAGSGPLLKQPYGYYKISEEARHQLEEEIRQAEDVQRAAEERFRQLLATHAPTLGCLLTG